MHEEVPSQTAVETERARERDGGAEQECSVGPVGARAWSSDFGIPAAPAAACGGQDTLDETTESGIICFNSTFQSVQIRLHCCALSMNVTLI